jgi:hypothetical protein
VRPQQTKIVTTLPRATSGAAHSYKKIRRDLSWNGRGVLRLQKTVTPVILATWEAEIRRMAVQGQPVPIVCDTPISKIVRENWTGSVVQVVEHLLCKCESLSSNPNPIPPPEK